MAQPNPALAAATAAVHRTGSLFTAEVAKVEKQAYERAAATALAAALPMILNAIEDVETMDTLSIEPLWDQKQAILKAVRELLS